MINKLFDLREWLRGAAGRGARWVAWSPWRVAAVVALVVVVLIVAVQLRGTGPADEPEPVESAPDWPAATAEAGPTNPEATGTPTPTAEPTAGDSPDTAPTNLSGDELGRAWITGFLTRSTPEDGHWQEAIEPLSTPELIETLADEGTDSLAIGLSGPWAVTKIKSYTPPDPVADTPSRVQLPYIVTIGNGDKTQEKPFILTAYRVEHGWLVAVAEQPYTSEG